MQNAGRWLADALCVRLGVTLNPPRANEQKTGNSNRTVLPYKTIRLKNIFIKPLKPVSFTMDLVEITTNGDPGKSFKFRMIFYDLS